MVSSLDNKRTGEQTDGSIGNGKLVRNVSVSTSATQVSPGLGRTPSGAVLVAADTPVIIAVQVSGQSLSITADTAATISIWAF